MKKESIKQAINVIIEGLNNSNIEQIDRVELMTNLYNFLEHYDEDIKVLRKEVVRNERKEK